MKVQQLDSKIQIISEMTPGLDKEKNITYQKKIKEDKTKIIMEKVSQLEKLVSHLKPAAQASSAAQAASAVPMVPSTLVSVS